MVNFFGQKLDGSIDKACKGARSGSGESCPLTTTNVAFDLGFGAHVASSSEESGIKANIMIDQESFDSAAHIKLNPYYHATGPGVQPGIPGTRYFRPDKQYSDTDDAAMTGPIDSLVVGVTAPQPDGKSKLVVYVYFDDFADSNLTSTFSSLEGVKWRYEIDTHLHNAPTCKALGHCDNHCDSNTWKWNRLTLVLTIVATVAIVAALTLYIVFYR